jgi:hypothetical protein
LMLSHHLSFIVIQTICFGLIGQFQVYKLCA